MMGFPDRLAVQVVLCGELTLASTFSVPLPGHVNEINEVTGGGRAIKNAIDEFDCSQIIGRGRLLAA